MLTYEGGTTTWVATLQSVADDSAEKWCRKFKSKSRENNNCEVYTFDTVEMVRHRLGPGALPQQIQAALGLEPEA